MVLPKFEVVKITDDEIHYLFEDGTVKKFPRGVDFSNAKVTKLTDNAVYYLGENGVKGFARRTKFVEQALTEAISYNQNSKLLFAIEAGLTELLSIPEYKSAFKYYVSGEHKKRGRPSDAPAKKLLDRNIWLITNYWLGYGLRLGSKNSDKNKHDHAILRTAEEVSRAHDHVYEEFRDMYKSFEKELATIDDITAPISITSNERQLFCDAIRLQRTGIKEKIHEFVKNYGADEGVKKALDYYKAIQARKKFNYFIYKRQAEIDEGFIKSFLKLIDK